MTERLQAQLTNTEANLQAQCKDFNALWKRSQRREKLLRACLPYLPVVVADSIRAELGDES